MTLARFYALFAAIAVASFSLTAWASAPRSQDHGQRKYSYALVTKNGKAMMENWEGDQNEAKIHQPGPDRLFVKKDGKLFVITDAASIAKFKKAMEPVLRIAAQQPAIGNQQTKIGDKQTQIGSKQSKLGEEMSKIGEQMSEQPSSDEMKKLQDRMQQLQAKMDELSKQMDEPSKRQEALGRQQDALGKQQEKASVEAESKITSILDDAFAAGLARTA